MLYIILSVLRNRSLFEDLVCEEANKQKCYLNFSNFCEQVQTN